VQHFDQKVEAAERIIRSASWETENSSS